ncbi:Orn/Lys/Arg decarboxylase N-terminal domain-containing protein [Leucobacter sp. CX42]|uniref:Orn/Lys/Arg decarboxylase N-terminal domain-containing protein n=1 Tax=unclassified Leucobacter TaxID=2621730 RepID=UPI001BFECB74
MKPEFPIMLVSHDEEHKVAGATAFSALADALTGLGLDVVSVPSAHETTIASLTSRVSAVIFSVAPRTSAGAETAGRGEARLVTAVRERNERLPIFLFGEQLTAREIPSDVLRHVHGCINAFEDTSEFVARSIARPARSSISSSARTCCALTCATRSKSAVSCSMTPARSRSPRSAPPALSRPITCSS